MLLHGILFGPVSSSLFVLLFVSLVNVGDFWLQRVFRIWIGQSRTDRQKDLADSKSWTPFILEDVQADTAVCVDV